VLARIRSAIAKKNAAELASAAHLLKGSVAIFGAPEVVAAARNLETFGRANNLREATAGLNALESEFARLQHELRAIHTSAISKPERPSSSRATAKRPRRKT
jgi:HPt (histidine-containing phosphotransfer) domain-containing protein